jgi:uncharacterized damage-inducible protein DinB
MEQQEGTNTSREIKDITRRLREHHAGDPWYGKSTRELLKGVDESIVFEQPAGGHSILQLLWHMIVWREFVYCSFVPQEGKDVKYFDTNDWPPVDHADKSLWQKGLVYYEELHGLMMEAIEKQNDSVLEQTVPGRKYNYRYLLEGIGEHDVYHLGQIAILNKMLRAEK